MMVSKAVTDMLPENRLADKFKSAFNGGKKEELSDEDMAKLDIVRETLGKFGITDLEQGRFKGEPGFYFWKDTSKMARIGKILSEMGIGAVNVGGGDREPGEDGSRYTKDFAKIGGFGTI